jgi:hypothetical protein
MLAAMPTALRIRRPPAEQGSSLALSAVIAASQSMTVIGVQPLVPCSMKRLVKSSRWREELIIDYGLSAAAEPPVTNSSMT